MRQPIRLTGLLLLGLASPSLGQGTFAQHTPAEFDPAVAFLRPYGLNNFTNFYKRALRTWLKSSWRHERGEYQDAGAQLTALWNQNPTGAPGWGNLPTQPFGINIGSPPCYYSLRMLSDANDWRIQSSVTHSVPVREAVMSVILVGNTHGIEPRSLSELQQGTGIPVTHQLDGRLLDQDNLIVHQSLGLFEEYVFAMTDGMLGVDVNIIHLPAVDMEVHATINGGSKFAGLVDPWQVWQHLSEQQLEETDWWWLIYPSHVPEQYPDFTNAEFITGGMGTGATGASPLFLIDDRWLVRKPPHIGTGEYSVVEREAYLPQWLQHEFFHHLFRTYPEFGLEDTPHQWFNPATWPADFDGRYEADYFHEAMFKRLQGATPPLHVALRYATADAPWETLDVSDVVGSYRREPVQNAWHIGTISQVTGNSLLWSNNAGVSWVLDAQLLDGELLTGPDCPYYNPPNGTKFDIVLERDALGDLTSVVEGFSFSGELYEKQ